MGQFLPSRLAQPGWPSDGSREEQRTPTFTALPQPMLHCEEPCYPGLSAQTARAAETLNAHAGRLIGPKTPAKKASR